MAKVSIIVPVYNSADYLVKCLNSLIEQTFNDIEIIMVNDGSTDDSVNIIKKFMESDNRIKLLNKENGGIGSARNLGMKASSSPYLMFVDADDYVDETIVEKLIENLESNNSDVSICDLYKKTKNKKWLFHNLEFFCDDDVTNFMLSHPGPVCRLYKRELFQENNIFFLEGFINEDLGTIPLLGIYIGKVSYIKEALYYYTIHENSTTMQTVYSKKMEDIFEVLNYLRNEFDSRCPNQYGEVLEYLYIEHLLYSASLKFIDFKEGIDQINKIVDIIKNEFPNWKNNCFYKKKSFKFKIVCNLVFKKNYILVKMLKKFRK